MRKRAEFWATLTGLIGGLPVGSTPANLGLFAAFDLQVIGGVAVAAARLGHRSTFPCRPYLTC